MYSMCGITASVGNNISETIDAVCTGLNALQNRGNDSFGLSVISEIDNKILVEKLANPNKEYFNKLMNEKITNLKDKTSDNSHGIAIGHCRWATHGINTTYNAHPHMDSSEKFVIVHNGTIDNCLELRRKLEGLGYTFNSDTDTEVIVNLVSYHFQRLLLEKGATDVVSRELFVGFPDPPKIEDLVKLAIYKTTKELKGIWACALMTNYLIDKVFIFSQMCPLVIGWSNDYMVKTVASEKSAFDSRIKHYGRLKDGLVISLGCEQYIDSDLFKCVSEYKGLDESSTPDPFSHWMLKEIHDQQLSTTHLMQQYLFTVDGNEIVRMPKLDSYFKDFLTSEHLILIGCGTSYYAGKYCRHFLTDLELFRTVQCIDASEFDLSYLPRDSKVICILLSQSGETMDLIRVQEQLTEKKIINIAVVNVEGSTIFAAADSGLSISAGKEVAVASTKSYTNQVLTIRLICLWLEQGLKKDITLPIRSLKAVPNHITQIIQANDCLIKTWADSLAECERVFILGKKIGYSIAKEASLKLKEVGYIHSEAYSASALKHGPYSLIEEGKPIIFIVSKEDKNEGIVNTITEVRSRGAVIYLVTDCQYTIDSLVFGDKDSYLKLPYNCELFGILQIIPFQLLAYYLALKKGHNPDFPRNLAKSVTVD